MRARAAIVWGFVLMTGCGSSTDAKHSLEGSLNQEMDLGYDQANLVVSTAGVQEFSIAFERNIGTTKAVNTILEVTVRVDQAQMEGIKSGKNYDLSQNLSDGQPRGVISRNVLDDPRTMFPKFRMCGSYAPDGGVIQDSCAQLELFNIPKQGQNLQAAGTFHITFENGVDFASGRTVFGSFSANFP